LTRRFDLLMLSLIRTVANDRFDALSQPTMLQVFFNDDTVHTSLLLVKYSIITMTESEFTNCFSGLILVPLNNQTSHVLHHSILV